MLSVSTGYDVAYLTGPVAGGREGYYTGAVAAGEPAGLWYGAGAEELGLRGEIDADLMEAVYSHLLDPRDPATHSRASWGQATALTKPHRKYRSADEVYAELLEANPDAGPEHRAELRAQAERSARQAVSFIDATFSAPKSVTVLGVAFERMANEARAAGELQAAAAWAEHQKAVEDAVLAGSRAALDYLQDQAGYSRVGHHGGGAGRWLDAHAFVVAQFLQHDSRDRDPQLHVHNAILNRVRCADGQWRTLDSQAIKAIRPAAAAVGERVMETHLTRSLGVRFATRPDGKAREVLGVSPAVMELFSSRRRALTAKAKQWLDAYRQRTGREPSGLERYRISQRATLATRAAKSHNGETTGQRLDRLEAKTRTELVGGLADVAHTVLSIAQQSEPAARWSPRDVIERALATAGEGRQTWNRAELTRRISDALPGHLGIGPEQVRELLDGMTDEAIARAVRLRPEERADDLPADRRLANGTSAFARPWSDLFATSEQLAAEQALRAAAVERGAVALSADEAAQIVGRFAESGCELGADQAAAVRGVLTSGARVEVLCAAAGTGKSFVVGAIADAWRDGGRGVFGLASWQAATEVLAEEGLTARNVERWLATQHRLDTTPAEHVHPDDEGWRLRGGDLVVVDEAATLDTASLLEIHRRCQAAGAKLLLVGDPRQLAAVGAGGTLADLAERGIRYELAEVRRFAADWEAAASLRLRDAEIAVLDTYAKHGRILDAGTAEQAETAVARAWLADTLAGRDTLALVPTNEAAARLSATLRGELVALGLVEETGVPLPREETVAGVGDLVQARRNGWELIGHEGNTAAPINRRCYRVTATRDDGTLIVAEVLGRPDGTEQWGRTLTLPPEYVAEHVTLGYASTVHAAQGRTVDTTHLLVGPGTDHAAAYVGLTRGRERNTAYCVTLATSEDAAPGEAASVEERTGRAVLADILTRDQLAGTDHGLSALALAEREAEAARSVQTSIERLAQQMTAINTARLATELDRLTADGVLPDHHRVALAADQALGSVQQLLRTAELAGYDPADLLHRALAHRPLDGAHSTAQVLHGRLSSMLRNQPLTPRINGYADLIPDDVPADCRDWLQRLAAEADERRRELGARVAQDPPQWALEALGPVPVDVLGREDWEHRAGWAAAYRELADHTDHADPLGAAPPAGLAEQHTAWRAASDALRLPEPSALEHDMTEGRLRIRVRAWERELDWAPRWVADELTATHQAAEKARIDAELIAARATAAQDDTERQRLHADAAAAARNAEDLAERAAALELADTARARWFVATAATRDAAERAKAELGTRNITLDAPAELVTAAEWLDAHRADQATDETTRDIRDEAELYDATHAADQVALDAASARDEATLLDTAVPDIRQISTRDATEAADPAQLHRIPTADETADAIACAQAALAEIHAREHADAQRAAEEARRDQLLRWAEQDRAAQAADYGEVREC